MPLAFDTTGLQRHDERTWFDPRTGDQVSLTYFDLEPDLPAPLEDLPLLRQRLAHVLAEAGTLVEAHVVTIDSVPALYQVVKLPIPGRQTGLMFVAALTVPKATGSVVLQVLCQEGNTSGIRESMVSAQIGFENCFPPHPYAPGLQGMLPWNVADDQRWDSQFPDHPLSRARAWAHRTIQTARVDPNFARQPAFRPHQPTAPDPAPGTAPGTAFGTAADAQQPVAPDPIDVLNDLLDSPEPPPEPQPFGDPADPRQFTAPEVIGAPETSSDVTDPPRFTPPEPDADSQRFTLPEPVSIPAEPPTPAPPHAFTAPGTIGAPPAPPSPSGVADSHHFAPLELASPLDPPSFTPPAPDELATPPATPEPPAPSEPQQFTPPEPPEPSDRLTPPGALPREAAPDALPSGSPAAAAPETLTEPPAPPRKPRPFPAGADQPPRPSPVPRTAPPPEPSEPIEPIEPIEPEKLTPPKPGDVLHTVLVGIPIGDYLPLWQRDGQEQTVTFWRMSDPDAVRARLGTGVESRSAVDTGRFREAAMFSPERQMLFLMDRYRDDSGHLGGTSEQLFPATEEEAYQATDDKALSGLYSWLGEVVLSAARRGEFVAVETGGWDVPVNPVVLVMLRNDGRNWHSVVETSPVPVGAPVWRDQQPVEGDTQILASPATDQTLRASGLLTRFAINTWSMHPFELGISFGPNPTVQDE